MIIKFIKPRPAFTLMEILIVVALLALVATALLASLDPFAQTKKGQDSKRKSELVNLQKIFEDFYNDRQSYPKPDEVCYNGTDATTTCNICGNRSDPPAFSNFSPYLSRLPCDPRKDYLYQVDSTIRPTYYRIYTTLANKSDTVITSVGCQYGCGPPPDFNYNYGVSSPNIGLEANTNLCSLATNLYINPLCNICGGDSDGSPPAPYEKCKISYPGEIYYTDHGSCTTICIKD